MNFCFFLLSLRKCSPIYICSISAVFFSFSHIIFSSLDFMHPVDRNFLGPVSSFIFMHIYFIFDTHSYNFLTFSFEQFLLRVSPFVSYFLKVILYSLLFFVSSLSRFLHVENLICHPFILFFFVYISMGWSRLMMTLWLHLVSSISSFHYPFVTCSLLFRCPCISLSDLGRSSVCRIAIWVPALGSLQFP